MNSRSFVNYLYCSRKLTFENLHISHFFFFAQIPLVFTFPTTRGQPCSSSSASQAQSSVLLGSLEVLRRKKQPKEDQHSRRS